ncbi:hypothetical protein [Endozoicomonas elysicola]|uniref:Uncharacterized protein n=1 Tax=Endozoicomonas elysicola TaxID=305900 RepID=A0A081K853_9GAMM|nr:hypothetical protein [Endozoicomonas elysicola]KEI70329.1 hypothetical protein GV64_05935 [Endozoicomonas elysicola]
MARPYFFEEPSLNGIFWGDRDKIPLHLMNPDIEKALKIFRQMEEFLYIEFKLGKPTYVFLMQDICPSTRYDWAKVSITDRSDMKYVFVYNDPHPEERWWIDYQPVDESGIPVSTERCVGWFINEFAAFKKAKEILAQPDRVSKVN